ncbi:MAG TPA: hypothetical protein VK588_00310 [Chitinophagaceae bacterium]|nr:hypothetical protein [Chitinophagaceae bacterium]
MKLIFFYLCILVMFLWFGCNGQSGEIPKHQDTLITNSSSIKKEIPLNKSGAPDYVYRSIVKRSEGLGLNDLKNGYDSIQIRIWYPFNVESKRAVVIFKRPSKGGWVGEYYDFKYTGSLDSNNIEIIDKTFTGINPKSGWPFFPRLFLN